MGKLPSISGKTAVKAFIKIGYKVARQRGSHIRLHHEDRKPLTIPDHRTLGKGLLRKLLRDSELYVDDFIILVKEIR